MPQGQVPRKILLIWLKRQGVAWTADALMLAAKGVSPMPAAVSSGAAVRVKPSNHRRTNKRHVLGVLRVFLVRRANAMPRFNSEVRSV